MPKINKQYTTSVDVDFEVDGEIAIYNAVIFSSHPDDNAVNKTCRGIAHLSQLQEAIDNADLTHFPNGCDTKHFDERRRYFLVHKDDAQALIEQTMSHKQFHDKYDKYIMANRNEDVNAVKIDKDILKAYRSGEYVVWHIKEVGYDWNKNFFFDTSNKCVYFDSAVILPSALEWYKVEKKKDPKAMVEWGTEMVSDMIKKTVALHQEKQCFIPEFENERTGIISEGALKNMASGNHILFEHDGYGRAYLKVENPAVYDEVFQIANEMCAHSGEYGLGVATRMAFMKYFDMDKKMGYDIFDFFQRKDGHPPEYFNYFNNILLRHILARDLPITSNNTKQRKI